MCDFFVISDNNMTKEEEYIELLRIFGKEKFEKIFGKEILNEAMFWRNSIFIAANIINKIKEKK